MNQNTHSSWDNCPTCGRKLIGLPYPGLEGSLWCPNCNVTYSVKVIGSNSTKENSNDEDKESIVYT